MTRLRGRWILLSKPSRANEEAFERAVEEVTAISTTREAVEEFVREDPFVLEGVVRGWQIHVWDA